MPTGVYVPADAYSVPGMGAVPVIAPPTSSQLQPFLPPGMPGAFFHSLLPGGRGGRGSGEPLSGVTVTGKECDHTITLTVHIVPGSDPSGRGKKLLQRVSKVLSKMGPWDCCPKDSPKCLVKLGLDITDPPTPGGKAKRSVAARFYNSETERSARIGTEESDVFGLSREDGSIEIPSIGEWAANLPRNWGGLTDVSESDIPEINTSGHPPGGEEVGGGLNGIVAIGFAYDVMAVILHEVLHSLGATHDDETKPNIMNTVGALGGKGMFKITTRTACEIAKINKVCIGKELEACCRAIKTDTVLPGIAWPIPGLAAHEPHQGTILVTGILRRPHAGASLTSHLHGQFSIQ